tara:strand:+ start:3182 stop:3715 length:534 start_codon:yes stop_codon:yes gene_type:complete
MTPRSSEEGIIMSPANNSGTRYRNKYIGNIFNNIDNYNDDSDQDDRYRTINENNINLHKIKQRFNNLDIDVKHLVSYAESLFCTVRNHEQTIYRMNGDLNIMHDRVCHYQELAKTAEQKIEEVISPETICCICMENPREMVYINCGHLCACAKCERRIDDKCPICRTASRAVKIIYS